MKSVMLMKKKFRKMITDRLLPFGVIEAKKKPLAMLQVHPNHKSRNKTPKSSLCNTYTNGRIIAAIIRAKIVADMTSN